MKKGELSKSFRNTNKEETNKLFFSIFENSTDGMLTICEDGLLMAINPSAAMLFGYDPDELMEKHLGTIIPLNTSGELEKLGSDYMHSELLLLVGKGQEVIGTKKDGSVFDLHLSLTEVQLESKKAYTGIIHDISESKSKESEIEEIRHQFRAVFETAVDGIIIISSRGIIKMVNPATIKLFQYEMHELIGNNIKMLMPEPHHTDHDSYLHNYKTTGEAKIIGIGREVQGKRKDGSLFPFNLGVSKALVGDKVFYTGVIHDLTEQKIYENEIVKLNRDLEKKVNLRTEELSNVVNQLLHTNKLLEQEVNDRTQIQDELTKRESELREALNKEKELGELKSRFVSMASHEFRTPMSTILSSASLIGRYTADDAQDKRMKHVHRIKSSVQNLTGILNDFLSLSKMEEGKLEIKRSSFAWKDFCDEMEEVMSIQLKPGQKFIRNASLDNFTIYSDKHILKNIFYNLLSNAIKYSGENSTIHCQYKIVNDVLQIEIRDEGIGIPKEDQTHMFTRFFRANNVNTIQGTGLGLTIVKRYLDILGGKIHFESEISKGTTFFVEIPIK